MTVLTGPTQTPPPTALVFSPSARALPPPTVDDLRFNGRGLRAGEAEAIAASKGLIAIVARLNDPNLGSLHRIEELARDVARTSRGVIWDEATRELYSVDEWQRVRIDGWEGDRPEVRRQIAVRYDDSPGGKNRLITLGMVKLGLPDLELVGVAPGEVGGVNAPCSTVWRSSSWKGRASTKGGACSST